MFDPMLDVYRHFFADRYQRRLLIGLIVHPVNYHATLPTGSIRTIRRGLDLPSALVRPGGHLVSGGRLLGQEWPIKYFTKLRQDNSVSVSVDTCGVSEDGD